MTNFNYVFDWTTWFNDPGTSNTIAEQAFDPLNPTAITVTPTTIQGAGAGVAPNAPTDSIEIGAFVETDFDNNGNQITVTPTAPSGSNPPTGVSDTQFGADTGFLRFAIDGPSGQGTAREQAAINLLFNNTDANGSPGVSNLSFNLLDIDNSAFFRDQVRVEVFDTDGNLVPVGLVNLTPVDPSRFAIDSSNDQITATAGSDVPLDQPTGNVLVSVDGSVQVGRVRIVYTSAQPGSNPNSNTFYQTIGIGDLNYTADIDVGIYDDTDPGAPSAGIDDGTVFGTADNDVIFGGLQARGDPGALNDDTNPNDTIEGRDGDDTLYAGIGFDTLYGGADDDTLFAGENDDTLYGGDGNDTLEGEAGNDTLFGDGGNDTLFGGAGGELL